MTRRFGPETTTPNAYPDLSPGEMLTYFPCQAGEEYMTPVIDEWRRLTHMASMSVAASNNVVSNPRAYEFYQNQAKNYLAQMMLWTALPSIQAAPGQEDAFESFIDELYEGNVTSASVSYISRINLWHLTYVGAKNDWINELDEYVDFVSGKGFKILNKKIKLPKTQKFIIGAYLDILDDADPLYKQMLDEQTGRGLIIKYNESLSYL